MENIKRSDSAKTFPFNSWRDITPLQASLGTMLHNKTGSWRFIKPIYEDKVPICQNRCPAGNDIEGWIRLINQNEYEKAYWHLKREQPFPSILGRVCFTFCKSACNRSELDQSININALERFLSDQVSASTPNPEIPLDNGKKVTIIGSGPAGMSAAYFARLLGFKVTILEKSGVLGGLLREGIPAYRLPKNRVEEEFKGLANMGIELKTGIAVGKDIPLDDLLSSTDFLFLATGAHLSIDLDLPGAGGHPKVMNALNFLEHISRQSSGSDALHNRHGDPHIDDRTDGRIDHPGAPSMSQGENVVVIGGGNTALDAARSAVRLGCNVTVVYRRSEKEMPAHAEEVAKAKEEGVTFSFLAAPERVVLRGGNGHRTESIVKENDWDADVDVLGVDVGANAEKREDQTQLPAIPIDHLLCSQMILGDPDESGRRRPVKKEGETFTIPADTILIAIGEKPDMRYLGGKINCEQNAVDVDDTLRVTEIKEGRAVVFAGGDMVDGPRTVVHAVAYGKRAAIAMDCYQRDVNPSEMMKQITIGQGPGISFTRYRDLLPIGTFATSTPFSTSSSYNLKKVVDSGLIVYDYFNKAAGMDALPLPPAVRSKSFAPYQETFSEEEAAAEAARCMHCGRCTACDNCLVFCPDVSVLVKSKEHSRSSQGSVTHQSKMKAHMGANSRAVEPLEKQSSSECAYEIDYDYCKGCGICATECPRHAITMENESIADHTVTVQHSEQTTGNPAERNSEGRCN